MSRERQVALIIFALIAVLLVFDIVHDIRIGVSIEHMVTLVIMFILATIGGTMLIRGMLNDVYFRMAESNQKADQYRIQAELWRDQAKAFLQGLGREIERQFDLWNLTDAEKEVAILLIKGLSTRELAEIRKVKEKTIRQQCLSIYNKAGINSRPELVAFFLEDLLPPQSPTSGPDALDN